MQVIINFVGGPQNGTIELNYKPGSIPQQLPPSGQMAYAFYDLTQGKVGGGTSGATPAAYALLVQGDRQAIENLQPHEKTMTYHVTERKEEGGVVYLIARYAPQVSAGPDPATKPSG